MNPWKERFAWFWYNDDEIFRFSDEDFDRKAAEFAKNGITTVITFSSTHFRWNYRPWWPKLYDVLRRIVRACHAHGIKVVEHHSSQLTSAPKDEHEWELVEYSFAMRNSSIDSWPGLRERFADFPEEYKPWLQIDGRTGTPARSNYMGWCMCFNNPDYRAAYMEYMKGVLETGVDGVMNDDVQYFSQSCACPHCRKLFYEQTGYELPDPEHWPAFWENYADPVYVAFRRFRLASTTAFYNDLTAYYESLGYHHLMRPNYISGILRSNWSSCPFETAGRTWTHIFQENYVSAVRQYSYPEFALEMLHRNAMASRSGVPSMSLFYPERDDDYYFTWALSRLWGQLYLATRERGDLNELEYKYRAFEKAHEESYIAPKRNPDLALYQSAQTRDYTQNSRQYIDPFLSWTQSAYFSGIAADMVFENDTADELGRYPMILLPHAAMLSDEELCRLRGYAEQGGKLVFVGKCGIFRADGSPRPVQEVFSALGMRSGVNEEAANGSGTFCDTGRSVELDDVRAGLTFACGDGAEALLCTDGKTTAIRERCGTGEIVWLPDVCANPIHGSYVSDIRKPVRERANMPASPIPLLRRTSGAVLNALLGGVRLTVESKTDLLSSAYTVEHGYALHLFNIEGTLPDHAITVGHEDVVTTFAGAYKLPDAVTVRFEKPAAAPVREVVLSTPECGTATPLSFTDDGKTLAFTVPAGLFGGYALIDARV